MMNAKFLSRVILLLPLTCCKTVEQSDIKQSSKPKDFDQKSELMWFDDGFFSKKNSASRQKIAYLRFTRDVSKNGLKAINHCTFIHGYGLSQSIAEKIQGSEILMENFVGAYFGSNFSSFMLDQACQSLYIPVIDSNDSTILEMTMRMEKFIANVSCSDNTIGTPDPFKTNPNAKQRSCAVVGHSKGGAVATNIARRCMQMTSAMGQEACERVAEIYSATGVNQGAGAAILLYGAKGAGPLKDNIANYILNFNWHKNDRIAGDVFGKELATAIGFAWNVDGEEKTNPTWFDLHPGTPMEGGVPLYVINNIALERKGWLKGDYAASGVAKIIDGSGSEMIGCGKPLDGKDSTPNRRICTGFGMAVGQVHSSGLQSLFIDGIRYSRNNNRFFDPKTKDASYLKAITWDAYNVTDGFAEISSTLGVCKRSPLFKKNCITFDNLNHQATAGGAMEAAIHMADQLKEATP